MHASLRCTLPSKDSSLCFGQVHFTCFSLGVLRHRKTRHSCSPRRLRGIRRLSYHVAPRRGTRLVSAVVMGARKFVSNGVRRKRRCPIHGFHRLLTLCGKVSHRGLERGLYRFLGTIVPIYSRCKIGLYVRPSSPPFRILNLPHVIADRRSVS